MPAYMIFLRESPLREPAEYAEYQRMGRQNTGDFKIKPLSVYGAIEAVEGTPPDGVTSRRSRPSCLKRAISAKICWHGFWGARWCTPHCLGLEEFVSAIRPWDLRSCWSLQFAVFYSIEIFRCASGPNQ